MTRNAKIKRQIATRKKRQHGGFILSPVDPIMQEHKTHQLIMKRARAFEWRHSGETTDAPGFIQGEYPVDEIEKMLKDEYYFGDISPPLAPAAAALTTGTPPLAPAAAPALSLPPELKLTEREKKNWSLVTKQFRTFPPILDTWVQILKTYFDVVKKSENPLDSSMDLFKYIKELFGIFSTYRTNINFDFSIYPYGPEKMSIANSGVVAANSPMVSSVQGQKMMETFLGPNTAFEGKPVLEKHFSAIIDPTGSKNKSKKPLQITTNSPPQKVMVVIMGNVYDINKNYFLCYSKNNIVTPPVGYAIDDETAEDAAIRIVREQTGLVFNTKTGYLLKNPINPNIAGTYFILMANNITFVDISAITGPDDEHQNQIDNVNKILDVNTEKYQVANTRLAYIDQETLIKADNKAFIDDDFHKIVSSIAAPIPIAALTLPLSK
jgi:hypothetical protein